MHLHPSGAIRIASTLTWLLLAFWLVLLASQIFGGWRAGLDGFLLLAFVLAAAAGLAAWVRARRERAIREAPLPQFLKRKLRQAYPQLTQKDAELVERGLRQFFLACSRSRRQFVSMPSRAVDAMWHEFILHTQAYRDWCHLVLGRFLHHTPAEVLGVHAHRNDGLRRAWYWCCKDEAINPRMPTRLPLLFALDSKLQIENGFHYVPDCRGVARTVDGQGGSTHCATDFSDGSASGDAGGFGGAESSSDGGGGGGDGGDGGGCGGGCGGD